MNFDREPVAQAAQRASDLVQRWGLDGTRLEEWAARNAVRRDNTGSQEYTRSRRLGAEGPTIDIKARALTDGRAYLNVSVVWDLDRSQVG